MNDTTLDSGGAGRTGLVVADSDVSLAGCSASGGSGGGGDCEFFGCGSGGSGGDGIAQSGPTSVLRMRQVTATGGDGGFGGDGVPAPDGQALDVIAGTQVVYPAPHREFVLSSPVRAGVDDLELGVQAFTGDVVLIWPALDVTQAFLPKYQGPLLISSPVGTGPILLGAVTSPSGELVVSLSVPGLPGLGAVDVTIQSLFDDGSQVLLGPAGTLTLLGP